MTQKNEFEAGYQRLQDEVQAREAATGRVSTAADAVAQAARAKADADRALAQAQRKLAEAPLPSAQLAAAQAAEALKAAQQEELAAIRAELRDAAGHFAPELARLVDLDREAHDVLMAAARKIEDQRDKARRARDLALALGMTTNCLPEATGEEQLALAARRAMTAARTREGRGNTEAWFGDDGGSRRMQIVVQLNRGPRG